MSKIADTHPELFHYTTAAGISGILESKSLWATHSSFVNDAEEILGFYDRILPAILRPVFQKHFEKVRNLPAFQGQQGNALFKDYCDAQTAKWLDAIKTTASLMHHHYITSFSIPHNDWVRDHGLLSQWRAYGSDGGYAIVFDTTAFDEILSAETSCYQEELFSWADAQYHFNENNLRTGDQDTDQRIEKLEIAADKFLDSLHSDSEDDAAEQLAKQLTILSSIFKHRGFDEERELRFVLSLLGPALESNSELQSVRQHAIKTRIRKGVAIPFVELCVREIKGVRQHLPIKRIIIGPHRDKHDRKRAVQLLLKQHGFNPDIVTVSDIPYRG
ncbi:MAG: DUF2971 domain-containing protein [Gallionella sp.]|nr:DUF2971 domain-containing protein [Gallionella sp.]MCK9354782.1 DUF2971 domain-containing protein [Gallionella sp.]